MITVVTPPYFSFPTSATEPEKNKLTYPQIWPKKTKTKTFQLCPEKRATGDKWYNLSHRSCESQAAVVSRYSAEALKQISPKNAQTVTVYHKIQTLNRVDASNVGLQNVFQQRNVRRPTPLRNTPPLSDL